MITNSRAFMGSGGMMGFSLSKEHILYRIADKIPPYLFGILCQSLCNKKNFATRYNSFYSNSCAIAPAETFKFSEYEIQLRIQLKDDH